MATGDGEEHGLQSLVESINRALECDICLEEHTDLRTLICCEKLVCYQCLEKVFEEEQQNMRHGGTPCCPLCTKNLTKKPSEYKVNKVVLHFQLYAQSLNKAVQRAEGEQCEMENCLRPFDKLCKSCKKFICYRCSSELCPAADDEHNGMDIRDCVAQSREEFNLWKTSKERSIRCWNEKKEDACAEIRKCGELLAAASNDSLPKLTEEVTVMLPPALAKLKEMDEKLAGEESALNFLVDTVKDVDDREMIYLMNQLDVYEEDREAILGGYETFVADVQCFDITGDNRGHILIAKVGGIDIVDAESKQLLRSVDFEMYVFTVEVYQELIILGVRLSDEEKVMVTLDQQYNELNRWSIPEVTQDFTVVDDKIFLSVGGDNSKNIMAYSLVGERLLTADILWNGTVAGITSVLPCSLVFDDRTEHKVYKQCVTSGKRRTDWAVPVKAPHCLSVDDNGLIWVRSNRNDCITILNRDGTKHQEEIMDDRITKFGTVNDLLVHDSYLYMAHEEGLGRFPVTYR